MDSIQGSVPLDLETVLFLDKGTLPLGHVFDVLGNISSPMYCVRFNSNKEILDKGLSVGMKIYVAPRTEHTHFVILGNLMKEKGCDASWEHDVEPPERCVEYSDDEDERSARKVRRGKQPATSLGDETSKRARGTGTTSENGEPYSSSNQHGDQNNGAGRGAFRGGRGRRGGMMPPNRNGHNHMTQQNWNQPQDNFSWHTNLNYGQQQYPPAQNYHHQQNRNPYNGYPPAPYNNGYNQVGYHQYPGHPPQ